MKRLPDLAVAERFVRRATARVILSQIEVTPIKSSGVDQLRNFIHNTYNQRRQMNDSATGARCSNSRANLPPENYPLVGTVRIPRCPKH